MNASRHFLDPETLRRLYREGRNLMEYLRAETNSQTNDPRIIQAAYDLQAGSYTAALEDPRLARGNQEATAALAAILDGYQPHSVLHVGTGEAITLSHVVRQMRTPPRHSHGLDVSLSRLLVGQRNLRRWNLPGIRLVQGEMSTLPFFDNAFDLVFSSHSLEPNGGNEAALLAEILRVSAGYVVLREPSYELGNAATRAHIEKHGYVRGLADELLKQGAEILEHRLWDSDENPNNQAALIVARKPGASAVAWPEGHPYASPVSGGPLRDCGQAYFCATDGLVFPVLAGIPCLLPEHGIFSSRYPELAAGLDLPPGAEGSTRA
jgi:SAM-dependent methyltransferase